MLRPVWSRVLITLWGIWFAAALTEPADLFGCPMHSAGAQAASIAQSTTTEHAHHVAVAAPGAATHHAAATEQAADQHGTQNPAGNCCSCIGQCATMSPALVPCDAPVLSVTTTIAVAPATYLPDARIPQHPALRLPFAIGPPPTTLL